jgi:hypothetical protein
MCPVEVSCIKCKVYSVLYTIYGIVCHVYNVLYTMSCIRGHVYSTLYTVRHTSPSGDDRWQLARPVSVGDLLAGQRRTFSALPPISSWGGR